MWWLLSLLPVLIIALGALGQYLALRDDELGVVVGGAALSEHQGDLSGGQPHGVAPAPSCCALPLSEAERATPAGAFGLEVREG